MEVHLGICCQQDIRREKQEGTEKERKKERKIAKKKSIRIPVIRAPYSLKRGRGFPLRDLKLRIFLKAIKKQQKENHNNNKDQIRERRGEGKEMEEEEGEGFSVERLEIEEHLTKTRYESCQMFVPPIIKDMKKVQTL